MVYSKRMDKRVKLDPPVKAALNGRKNRHYADITEISRGGLRILSEEKYSKGSKFEFEFQLTYKEKTIPVVIKAKIKNEYGAKTDNVYSYGIKFSRVPFIYFWEKSNIEKFVYFKSAPGR